MLFKHKEKSASFSRRREPVSSLETAGTFRRGQTLSSYHKSDDETSARQKTHHLNQLRRRLAAICGIFLLSSVLILGILSQFIVSIDISSNVAMNTDYQPIINEYYDNNPLERFFFLLDPQKLLTFLQQKAPEVQRLNSVSNYGIFSTLHLDIEFRQPVAKWQIGENSYYVDGTGKPFTVNYHSEPAITIVDENNLNIKLGETTIASNRFLEFVGRVVSDVRMQGLEVEKATIPVGLSRELDVILKDRTYRFKLSVDRSSAEQAEDIKRIVNYLDARAIAPSYVDLRVKGRAYYR